MKESRAANEMELDTFTKAVHLGLMVFGVLALLTSGLADDYKRLSHPGFTFHMLMGLGLSLCLALRLLYGFTGAASARFSHWVPYTRERLQLVWEDIQTLLQFRLPQRPTHQGLSGLVHAFGLLAFTWMASTGVLIALFLHPGRRARGFLHDLKEIHEGGEWLVIGFLLVHGGAVLLHALQGDHVWRKMVFLKDH